jgi:hypothetical protein
MDLRGQHIVAARDFDQLAQPRFELLVLVAQRRDLPLDSSVAWRSKKSGLPCR